MNEISSTIAFFQPQIIESKVHSLEKKVGFKKKKLPSYHLISLDKDFNSKDVEKFINEMEKFYSASENELSIINAQMHMQIELFTTNNQKEKQEIENENSFLKRKLNDIQCLLNNRKSPTPENIALSDLNIERTRNNIKILGQKSLQYQIEYQNLKQRIPTLKQKISKKSKEKEKDLSSIREKIENLTVVYNKNNLTSRNLFISTIKQENLIIQDKINNCCKELQNICKQKQNYFFKIREMHRIKDETHKITVKKNNFVKNQNKINNYVSHKRLEKLKEKNKNTKEELQKWKKAYRQVSSKQRKLTRSLNRVKEEIKDEDLKTELIEDTLFGDTEHTTIELINRVPITFPYIDTPENYFVGIDNLKNEIDNDVKELESNIRNENMEIILLKQKINEFILKQMENLDINNEDYENVPSPQQNKLKIEELEWKIKQLSKEINIKKEFLSNIKNINNDISICEITPFSFALLIANIENETSNWTQISQQRIGSELSKWNQQISNILSYNSFL